MAHLLFKKFAVIKVTFLCAIFGSDVWLSVSEASRSGCSSALGMQSGAIADSHLSCNTQDSGWEVYKGRLHNSRSWCSNNNDPSNEFFQIDLRRVRHVSAIATQGVKFLLTKYYVETYKIKYSYNEVDWFFYENENGADVIFTGNNNHDTVRTNYFRDTFVTRYLRILPKRFENDMCLRVEVYGCSDNTDDCTSYITSNTGSFTSPGHPVSYPANKDCTWLISVDSGKRIALMFTRFDIKHSSGSQRLCKDDYVEVRNGLTDISRQIGGMYCNSNKAMLVTSSRNVVRIYFHTGSSAVSISNRGFKIDYLSVTPGSNDVFAAKACDGNVISLDCSSTDYTINILHATYGIFPLSCSQQHTSSTCPALDVKNNIVSKCQDYKDCRFSVSRSLFGYSCSSSGSAKGQLEVFYQCTSRNLKTPAPTTPPPTPTKGSTLAPSTVSIVTTNSQPSHSFTDQTTASPTTFPSKKPLTTKPTSIPSQVVFTVPTDIPSPTHYVSESVGPPVGGREAQTQKGMSTGTMAGVIVVGIMAIILAVLIAVYVVRRKRQQNPKLCEQTVQFSPEREYSMPVNVPRKRCPLDVSSSIGYDTVNILYQSADNHSQSSGDGKEDHNINAYASCSVVGSLPKATENPLYKGVSHPSKNSDEEGYELVKPPSAAVHNYDSPSNDTLPKIKSINNPNYEQTLEIKNHEYAIPDLPSKPSC